MVLGSPTASHSSHVVNSSASTLQSTYQLVGVTSNTTTRQSGVGTKPQDLIRQLLIQNYQASKLLSNTLKQEQEHTTENTFEQQAKLLKLQQQQLKVKQNFQQLTLKLKECQRSRSRAVSYPGPGHELETGKQPVVNTEGLHVLDSSRMTITEHSARERPKESETKMDYRYFPSDELSPLLNFGDFPLSSEVVEGSIYASSPNSLYMYEQEKMDMQSTMPSVSGTNSIVDTCSAFQDDFELNLKYETSQDLSNSVSVTSSSLPQHGMSSAVKYNKGGGVWENSSASKQNDNVLIKNENKSDTNPTLAELNLDLLDDIQNFIDVDMNLVPSPSVQFDTMLDVKLETGTQSDKCRGTGIVVPNPVSKTGCIGGNVKIKQEPVDFPSYHNLQNVKAFSSPYIKSETSQTKTLEEVELSHGEGHGSSIDISDSSTLQQLLHGHTLASLVRTPRTRSISENMDVRPRPSGSGLSRKRGSTSAGLESMDRKWEEIKQFIQLENQDDLVGYRPSFVKRERKRYDSASSAITLTSNEDEDSDSDRDDLEDDSDSDFEGGTDLGMLNPEESLVGNSKEKQFFWQYNVQSKGPKGTRVHFDMEDDPHVLNDFEDPVFDPAHSNSGGVGITIKHGGRARKGDGNDIVPNPKRLCQIGLQLRKINRQINEFVPVNELPSLARNKTRKEKNKLASRACRLKKKAQHEAHKIKLNGLETEHHQLLSVILKMRKLLVERVVKQEHLDISMADKLDQLIKDHLRVMIGGNTTDYVNRVVRAVENGDMTGGINHHTRRSYPKELHN